MRFPRGCSPRDRSIPVALVLLGLAGAPAQADTYRVVFVTSSQGTGDLSVWSEVTAAHAGLVAADEICQVRAEAGGLATAGVPVFRAWMSDDFDDAFCRVQGLGGRQDDVPACGGGTLAGGGPWVRPDGVPYSGPLASLLDAEGGIWVPAAITELWPAAGSDLSDTDGRYFTGTSDLGAEVADRNCSGWGDGTSGSDYVGGTTNSVTGWSGGASAGCSLPNHLLCFEQGVGPTPPPPAEPGALVFVTSVTGPGELAAWPAASGASGIEAGDAICGELAALARLPAPESFVAWLSTGTIDALDRLTIDGPWRRLDGFRIADTKSDLADGGIDAPVLLDETGARWLEEVFTGTTDEGLAHGNDCADWLDGTSGSSARYGRATRTHSFWTSHASIGCDQPRPLYCFANVVTIFWDGFEAGHACGWSTTAGAGPC